MLTVRSRNPALTDGGVREDPPGEHLRHAGVGVSLRGFRDGVGSLKPQGLGSWVCSLMSDDQPVAKTHAHGSGPMITKLIGKRFQFL